MCNSNLEIQIKIKKEFLDSTGKKRNIKIPSGIIFNIEGNSVIMKLSNEAICDNLQEDASAFEGWALVLKRWGKYEKVIISWVKPILNKKKRKEHYQRFLFRLKQFSQDFNSWFSIDKDCQIFLDDLKIKQTGKYLLNIPNKRDEKDIKNSEEKLDGILKKNESETILENRFVYGDLKEHLMNITNADSLYRQLPVGVFEKKASKDTRVFTGGKSAIDIWGFSKSNELLVFELKAEKNLKVGIISELYFYVCVLQMVRKEKFTHEILIDEHEHLLAIPNTKKIKAYFLSPTLHPLVDKKILELLNEVSPDEISYHYIQFNEENKLTPLFEMF